MFGPCWLVHLIAFCIMSYESYVAWGSCSVRITLENLRPRGVRIWLRVRIPFKRSIDLLVGAEWLQVGFVETDVHSFMDLLILSSGISIVPWLTDAVNQPLKAQSGQPPPVPEPWKFPLFCKALARCLALGTCNNKIIVYCNFTSNELEKPNKIVFQTESNPNM